MPTASRDAAPRMAKAFDDGGGLVRHGKRRQFVRRRHVSVEFMHPIIEKRPALPAMALTTDTALLTAVGNDQDFSLVFIEQLRMLGRPGDIALGHLDQRQIGQCQSRAASREGNGHAHSRFLRPRWRRMPEALRLLLHRAELQHPPHSGDARDAAAHSLGPDPCHSRRGGRDLNGRDCWTNSARSPFGECPVPNRSYDHVLLGHGSGGQLTAELIQRFFVPGFGNEVWPRSEDQATARCIGSGNGAKAPRIAFTTDSFVVRRCSFPAAISASSRSMAPSTIWPSAAPPAVPVRRVHPRRRSAARRPGRDRRIDAACLRRGRRALVTGDTKVVDRGKGDGVFITTSGIGLVPEGRSCPSAMPHPATAILVPARIGDHGIAIMSVREGIEFETVLESDTRSAAESDAGHARGLSRRSAACATRRAADCRAR